MPGCRPRSGSATIPSNSVTLRGVDDYFVSRPVTQGDRLTRRGHHDGQREQAGQPEQPAAANIPAPRLPAESGGPLPAASPGREAGPYGSARLGQGLFLPPEPVRGAAGLDGSLAGPGRREFLFGSGAIGAALLAGGLLGRPTARARCDGPGWPRPTRRRRRPTGTRCASSCRPASCTCQARPATTSPRSSSARSGTR